MYIPVCVYVHVTIIKEKNHDFWRGREDKGGVAGGRKCRRDVDAVLM